MTNQKEKDHAARRGQISKDSDGQNQITSDCNPVEFRALAFACLTALNIARAVVNQMAIITAAPPFMVVEAANLIEHASELISNYLVTGGKP